MKTPQRLIVAALLAFAATAARAEDTRPPAISDVSAAHKGGKVTVSAKITDETGVLQAQCHYRDQTRGGSYELAPLNSKGDDQWQCEFPVSGGTIEYYLTAIDELGNGPSKSESKTLVVSG